MATVGKSDMIGAPCFVTKRVWARSRGMLNMNRNRDSPNAAVILLDGAMVGVGFRLNKLESAILVVQGFCI